MTYYADPAQREPLAADQRAGSKTQAGGFFLLGSGAAGAVALLSIFVAMTSSYSATGFLIGSVFLVIWAVLGLTGWTFMFAALNAVASRSDERWFKWGTARS